MSKRILFTLFLTAALAAPIGVWAAGEDSGTRGESTGRATNDAWLTTKVKSALLADQSTSGLDIQVETQKGIVQLSGFVGSETEKMRAGEVARGIEGVKEVKNDLRVRPAGR